MTLNGNRPGPRQTEATQVWERNSSYSTPKSPPKATTPKYPHHDYREHTAAALSPEWELAFTEIRRAAAESRRRRAARNRADADALRQAVTDDQTGGAI